MADTEQEEKGTWFLFDKAGGIRQLNAIAAAGTQLKARGGWVSWVPIGANILEYVPGDGNNRANKESPGEPPAASPGE